MRGLILTLLFVGCTEAMAQPWATTATFRNKPVSTKGFTPGTWPISADVPTPTNVWWGDDPTGSEGLTTSAWTVTEGATLDVSTIWEAKGVTLHSANYERIRAVSNSIWTVGFPFTVCGLFESTANVAVMNREDDAFSGWSIQKSGTGYRARVKEDYTAVVGSVTTGWHMTCLSQATGSPCHFYNNSGTADTSGNCTASYPGANMLFGYEAGIAIPKYSDMTMVLGCYWNSALTSTQITYLINAWIP